MQGEPDTIDATNYWQFIYFSDNIWVYRQNRSLKLLETVKSARWQNYLISTLISARTT